MHWINLFERPGFQARMAEAVGRSRQTVNGWKATGIPVPYCALAEEIGEFTVRRWHMRPDDWFVIWPELVGSEGAPAIANSEAA